jgi:hypothetical protein
MHPRSVDVSVCGCVLTRGDAVPVNLDGEARVPLADVEGPLRYRVGDVEDQAALAEEFVDSWQRERVYLAS